MMKKCLLPLPATTLMVSTTKRTPNDVAFTAKAIAASVHTDMIQHNSGTKHIVTSSAQRFSPLSWPKNVIRAEISQYLFRVILW